MESAASELGIEKRDLMSVDGDQLDSIAARVALGETHVIQQTKRWLEDEGIDASAFDRQGSLIAVTVMCVLEVFVFHRRFLVTKPYSGLLSQPRTFQ